MRGVAYLLLGGILGSATLSAQTGLYHFVELSVHGSGTALDVRNGGGTLSLSNGQAAFSGQAGAGADVAAALNVTGALSGGRLASFLFSGQTLEIHSNPDASVLVGSSASPGATGDNFDLLIAVRQGAGTPVLTGAYSAAYFAVNGGKVEGMVSAFMNFTAAAGAWNNVLLGGHTAARDDLNREEQPVGITCSVGAGGAGVVRFPPGSDYISGDRELMVSADGAWMLGYSLANRDIFVAQRQDADRSAASLNGLFWIAEMGAEEPFAFDAAQVRWSAAAGTLRADGAGRAEIAEQTVRQRDGLTANTWVSTANGYYADPSGRAALVPGLTADRLRNNFNLNLDGFIGAQVGTPGMVTLEHGLFLGINAVGAGSASSTVSLTQLGVFNGATFAIGPAAPLGYVTLFGAGLAPGAAVAAGVPFPTELAGTRVLVNGEPAPLQMVSAGQINLQWPAGNGPTATVQVSATAGLSNTLVVPVAASSPGVFRGAVLHADYSQVTASAPARPGEALIVFAAGLGAVNPPVAAGAAAGSEPLSRTTDATLRAYVDSAPAIVEFAGLAPGFAGLYQVNLRVPDDAASSTAAPLALSLADSFTDLAEIAIAQ